MLKRLIYFAYYLKNLNRKKFSDFLTFVSSDYKISKTHLIVDVFISSIKYNVSILDYFYFKFYNLNKKEKESFAGTGYMYEYQLQMNPKQNRNVLENKLLFLEKYAKFIRHRHSSKDNFLKDKTVQENLLNNPSNRLVLKSSDGQCGEGVEVLKLDQMKGKELLSVIENSDNDLIEEFILQHDALMNLSPSGLNTVRIFTQLNKDGKVDLLGCRLRITVDSYVDNLAAGNIAAPIDCFSGVVNGVGVYSDITKNDEDRHPVTNVKIKGFQVPFWEESVAMAKSAALMNTNNTSIGWDIAITNDGPELLEGNHNWCKLLWQLPVKQGLKSNLEKYL